MKTTFIGLALIVSTQVLAAPKATLRIPVMVDPSGNNDKPVNAAAINPKLIKAGVRPLPLIVEITTDDKDAYKKIQALDAQVTAGLKKIGNPDGRLATGYVPADLDRAGAVTCFTGDATLVAGLTTELTDVLYSDQYGIHGWKYKNISRNENDEALDGETNKFLNEGSTVWKTWNKALDAVLIASHIGDGGDDISESIINRCK